MISSRTIKVKQKLESKKDSVNTVAMQLTLTMNHDVSKQDIDNIIDEYTKNNHFTHYEVFKTD